MPWNMKHKIRFEYIWKVGDILKTTRDITLGLDAVLPEGSIVKIFSRNQGYSCYVLQPEVFDGIWCSRVRIADHDALREIHNQEWISILNDGAGAGDRS